MGIYVKNFRSYFLGHSSALSYRHIPYSPLLMSLCHMFFCCLNDNFCSFPIHFSSFLLHIIVRIVMIWPSYRLLSPVSRLPPNCVMPPVALHSAVILYCPHNVPTLSLTITVETPLWPSETVRGRNRHCPHETLLSPSYAYTDMKGWLPVCRVASPSCRHVSVHFRF